MHWCDLESLGKMNFSQHWIYNRRRCCARSQAGVIYSSHAAECNHKNEAFEEFAKHLTVESEGVPHGDVVDGLLTNNWNDFSLACSLPHVSEMSRRKFIEKVLFLLEDDDDDYINGCVHNTQYSYHFSLTSRGMIPFCLPHSCIIEFKIKVSQ